ncbi:transglutaminase domain-containing protein, partial [bacterium]|nr:transglutaminase domain-containing protein [bacterium]
MRKAAFLTAILCLIAGPSLCGELDLWSIPNQADPSMAPISGRRLRSGDYGSSGYESATLNDEGNLIYGQTSKTKIARQAEEALEIVPNWIRMDLYDIFTRLPQANQEDYGRLLLSITDTRLIDEVAFSIAHSSARILINSSPDLYKRNAELLYQIDQEIQYADIVDHGTPGIDPDFYSTVRYRTIRNGEIGHFELPLEIYYWYVAHPKLPEEMPSMSSTADDDNFACGYLWREYLFYNPSEQYDYSANFMVLNPNRIDDIYIADWGHSASGYLVDGSRTCPDGIIAHGPATEKPTLIEYSCGYCRVIVTTMEIEQAANDGRGELLENLVMRSSGYGAELLLPPLDPSGSYNHPDEVAIVDSSGDPSILGPITSVLNDFEIVHWVLSPEDMSEANWDAFSKIIIPSHQELAFYLAISSNGFMDKFNEWTGKVGGVLEFHGACAEENSWSDLQLFGLNYIPEPVNDLGIFGYPVLGYVIANASFLWDDSDTDAILPGLRPFEPDSMAVDVITNWVSRNMAFKRRGSTWRTQSNQICFKHEGYCGEIAHLLNAAARTCLLPSATVCDYIFDHVSNEFWERDWHGYEVGWEVGQSTIASQNMISSHAYAVVQERADMYSVNATARFTPVCRFHASVQDSQGNPVDCALVRTWVPIGSAEDDLFGTPISDYTDSSGQLVMELGDNHDYWFEVKSAAGNIDKIRILENTQADMDYTHIFTVSGGDAPQLPEIEPMLFPAISQPPYRLHVSFEADYEALYSLSALTFAEKEEGTANVDFFILDVDNFEKYDEGEPFSAYEWREDCKGDEFEVQIPDDELYYIVLSNEDAFVAKQFVTVNLDVSQNIEAAWTPIENYTNFTAIPAGRAYVIMFNNKLAPSVYAAGFASAEVNSSDGFELGIHALVHDPNGRLDVREVELCYDGVPLGKYMRDDGELGDSIAGDGIFTFSESYLPSALDPGVYRLEVQATDTAGNKSVSWPSMNVLSAPLRLSGRTCSLNTDI